MDHVIETEGLSCRYGRVDAVRELTMRVRQGSIYALLGPNGAGKTTTIDMLMNLVRPSHGRARVLGVDSRRLDPKTLAAIGYVSESQHLPEWMTVRQLVDYCRPLYPTWDDAFAEELRAQLDLDPAKRLKHLSRGMKVKAALLVSLAYRPRLLVLDEPFTGLDPVVREDLVRGVLRMADQEQWTVLLSSHDMDEVERLADWIGFLDGGSLQLEEPAEALLARFRRIDVDVAEGGSVPSDHPASWLQVETSGRALRFIHSAWDEGAEASLRRMWPSATIEIARLSLREIFVAVARSRGSRGSAVTDRLAGAGA